MFGSTSVQIWLYLSQRYVLRHFFKSAGLAVPFLKVRFAALFQKCGFGCTFFKGTFCGTFLKSAGIRHHINRTNHGNQVGIKAQAL